MIKAVIFDMDGTLIDTEKYYRKCWKEAIESLGYTDGDEVGLLCRSLGRPHAPQFFKERYGEDFDYWAVRETRKALVEKCVAEEGIQLKPGVEEILDFLKEKNIISAIATATPPDRTRRYLAKAKLCADRFDRIVSATEVKEGKPSPDVYLYAAEQLGLKPEECLAVEDAPNGVRAAYRAGMPVIMVPDQSEPDEELYELIAARCSTLIDVKKYIAERMEQE